MGGGGGGGGGGGMEVDLSHGAVAAMPPGVAAAEGLRPVLQVADGPHRVALAAAERYRLVLSDGLHARRGILASSLNGLVAGGALRRGSVVRLLDYACSDVRNQRLHKVQKVIIVINVEILQTECTLIGSPKIYDNIAGQPSVVPFSGGLGGDKACFMPEAKQGFNNCSLFPGQGMLGPSIAPKVEHSGNNLPSSGCYGSVPSGNSVEAKMQQLSFSDNQNRTTAVTGNNTYGSGVARNNVPCHIIPIAALNPYQGRWKIKARVTAKTDIKHYHNVNGHMKVFAFDLLDAQGSETRATCFNLQVDQYYDQIEVDKVYLISRGKVKLANRNFNPLNNDYELVLDHTTSIETFSGDESITPKQQVNFLQNGEFLENMEGGATTDQQNVGFTDLEARWSVQPSKNCYGNPWNGGGADYGHPIDQLCQRRYNLWTPAPPVCNGGVMCWSDLSAGNGSWDTCFKCSQHGHRAIDCPLGTT
ncbi:hypothetical protein ACP4OV_029267 [Aristida adscensionis]